MKRVAGVSVLMLITAFAGAVAWVGLTQAGARWAVAHLERILPLEIEGLQGSLLTGIELDSLVYRDESIRVEIDNFELAVAWRCAVKSQICIDKLGATSILTSVSPDGATNSESLDLAAILQGLPATQIDELQIDTLLLRAGGQEETLSDIRVQADLAGGVLQTENVNLCHRLGCVKAQLNIDAVGKWRLEAAVALTDHATVAGSINLPNLWETRVEGDATELTAIVLAEGNPHFRLSALAANTSEPGVWRIQTQTLGLETVLPQMNELPWLQLSGPLNIGVTTKPAGVTVNVQQVISGYREQPVELALRLQEDSGEWSLIDATLEEENKTLLSASGVLGTLDALSPNLAIEANRLPGPFGSDFESVHLSVSAQLQFEASALSESWSVRIDDWILEENEQRMRLSGALHASNQLLLPAGRVEGFLESPSLSAKTPFIYKRQANTHAAADVGFGDGIQLKGFKLADLNMRVQPGEHTEVLLRTNGDMDTALALKLLDHENSFEFELAPFELKYSEQGIRSEQSINGRWVAGSEGLSLDGFCFKWRESAVCASQALLGASGELPLQIELLESYEGIVGDKPYSVVARGAGVANLRWREGVLQKSEFSLHMDELSLDPLAEDGTAGPVHWDFAQAKGSFGADAADVSLQLSSPEVGSIDLQLSEASQILAGSLDLENLQLSAFVDLIPEWALSAGYIESALRLSGTRDAPQVFGDLHLVDGGLQISELDTAIDDLELLLDFDGQGFELEGAARLGGGEITAQGRCCLGGEFTGKLDGSRNRLQLPQGLDAVFSPRLALRLGESKLDVSGLITVHDGVYTHTQPAEGGIALSRDVVRVDAVEDSPRRLRLNLDIRTLIEPGFTLRSQEIESTLAGDLRLLLPADEPASLFGSLEVLGGELRVLGQALRLTDGDLGFVGDPLNPDLNISAEREIRAENQRVGFRVRGTLDEPSFNLFSDPPRPDNEALSYLLRGRGPDVGASADGTAMALSLGASALNQSGWLSSLNSIPGISGVAVGAEGRDDDTAATISAYVGNRLYLSYGVGIYEPVNALTARLYLQSRLWLEVVSRLESSFDLYYRFDRN